MVDPSCVQLCTKNIRQVSQTAQLIFHGLTGRPENQNRLSDAVVYNLFDERESGSSQILCSYLTMRSGVRYDTNNLA